MKTTPDQYKPESPEQLIGSPANSAVSLLKHALGLKHHPAAKLKTLMYGVPGCGKTTIAELLARALAAHAVDIQGINGRNLTIDEVRAWQNDSKLSTLFGGWKVKVINEADLIPAVAQDLMLTYLDELPPHTAVIASSNASRETLSERFATRFMAVRIDGPSEEEIQCFLRRRWHLPKQAAAFIAQGCDGNVRDALLRATSFLVTGSLEARLERPANLPVSASGSEAAKKAWVTRRANEATTNGSN